MADSSTPQDHTGNSGPLQKPRKAGNSDQVRQSWGWLLLAALLVIAGSEFTSQHSNLRAGIGGLMATTMLALAWVGWHCFSFHPRGDAGGGSDESDQLRDTRWTRDGVLVFFYVGAWGVLLFAFQYLMGERPARAVFAALAAATLTASSAAIVGALFGFLFAIPRALSKDKRDESSDATPSPSATRVAPAPARAVLGVNTNLEEISDWLTKDHRRSRPNQSPEDSNDAPGVGNLLWCHVRCGPWA